MTTTVAIARDDGLQPAGPASASRRFGWGYLAVALPAMLLTADGVVALARGWKSNSRLDTAILWAAAGWLGAATALTVLPAGRRFYSRYMPQLIALCASSAVAWVVAELAMGIILPRVTEPFHCRQPGLDFVYRPRPEAMRGVSPEAHVHFNVWGVRGDDPPEREAARRILCVGGSSTACTYLDNAKTWPHLLAVNLEEAQPGSATWSGNVGLPGFTTAEHLRFIEESPLVERMDCVVVQAGLNDFMTCLAGPRPMPLWTHSRVRTLARSLATQAAESSVQVEDTAGQVYVRRRALRAAAPVATEAPELDACLRSFQDNIRQIIETCRSKKVAVVFTTQPALWKAGLDAENAALLCFGRLADGRFLSVDQLRAGLDRYNEALREVCCEQDVEVVDLGSLDGDPVMFYDDCHFTEAGARRVAELIAEHLAAHQVMPPRANSP